MKIKELIIVLLFALLTGIGCSNSNETNNNNGETNNNSGETDNNSDDVILPEHNYIDGICSICGKKTPYTIDDGYAYFGEYPQTLKKLDVAIVSDIPDSDGYYFGSDGERYAKIVASPYYNSYYFNTAITDASGLQYNIKLPINGGETYYFKVEPIKWKIEDENNGTYKLISEYILDKHIFFSSFDDRTIDVKRIYSNNYEYSDIRSWLNNEFLNKAFSEELQEYIDNTEVDNSVKSSGKDNNKFACDNTIDKIYLPSYKDITTSQYGYDANGEASDSSRRKKLTDYARAIGCYMHESSEYYNNGTYWLRSPHSKQSYCTLYVDSAGYINNSIVYSEDKGVAPALTLTIK